MNEKVVRFRNPPRAIRDDEGILSLPKAHWRGSWRGADLRTESCDMQSGGSWEFSGRRQCVCVCENGQKEGGEGKEGNKKGCLRTQSALLHNGIRVARA
mmetsp:Transcript_18/g.50  ORF Transcript_18/g.50 Transcript_18/m.50 type:complete len:99 (+) Transcript_18:119-415(+)